MILRGLKLEPSLAGYGRRLFHVSPQRKATEEYKTVLLKTPLNRVRNIGIIAHIDAGKTTTTERMLYYSGVTGRIGNVDEGDTVTDYMTQEKDRGITIQSAAVTIPWNKHKINLIDTPGHADFTFEVIRSLRVLDGAVTILDAVAGVEAQTEKVWRQAKDLAIPIVAYVNKMDREGAGFGRTVKEIVSRLGTRVVIVNAPYFVKDQSTGQSIFEGVIDVFDKKLLLWNGPGGASDGSQVEVIDIAEDSKYPEAYEEVLRCREAAVEQLGEFDEDVMNSFFETEDYMKVPSSTLKKALRKACIAGYATPVLCGASFRNIGVQPLLDAVNDYLPSPLEIKPPEVTSFVIQSARSRNKKQTAEQDNSLPVKVDPREGLVINNNRNLMTALAFKVISHPVRGIMVFVRVYSGKLQPHSTVLNSRTGEKVRVGKVWLMNADMPQEVRHLSSGSIGVITGTDMIVTGDTLICHSVSKNPNQLPPKEKSARLLPIKIPPPVFSVSIEPAAVSENRKLEACLKTLLLEDPSLHLSYDEETGQNILSGMGELHLEITKDRLINDMKVNAEVGEVRVTYKETITAPTGYFTGCLPDGYEIELSLESFEGPFEELDITEEGVFYLEQDDNVVIIEPDGIPSVVQKALNAEIWSLPVSYETLINGILSGVTGALQTGGRHARLPLHSMIVRVRRWMIHQDANNVSPLISVTRKTILDALASLDDKATTLLEPIMKVSVYVSDEDLGPVSQDLMSARNAKITGIDDEASSSTADAIHWAKEQAEKTYVPHDPTLRYIKKTNVSGNKIIKAEAPLREMIGYLTKLRSLTRGRATYDMEFVGMQRTPPDRLRKILEH
ncbi:hypothetical protein KL933_003306 [Ogataea haglerorum]|uniref:Ribosome-releasing factor 2, mitochondrial n=1 Tax=Ogataea haglerorum TaxID=1937702 RepID=A0AAN6I054_9ASCO|nr:hypothetical protein KL915_003328 [Ogataea haglerorum]KAG7706419.1 hypothetical protein KL914_003314 [Ogataea haglerorum]KAG7724890.1 hypothetical protein KL948_005135 [Ogataea haglerorum]KAG7726375.1 hypothetical protein KL933_003306 [Ogataea haglerorum]KAG7737824.1 hypothetical protein KL923_003371 [Ogataea haglerorum]